MLLEHIDQGFSGKRFGEYVIHAWELVSSGRDAKNGDLPCWKYIWMSSFRILDVMAMIGVRSNCRIR